MNMNHHQKVVQIKKALEDEYGWQQTLIARVGVDIVELLLRKNRNYGGSVFTAPVLAPEVDVDAAIRVRMSDKVARLQTLLSGDKDLVGESIDDTFADLVGYIVLLIAHRQNSVEEKRTKHKCVFRWNLKKEAYACECGIEADPVTSGIWTRGDIRFGVVNGRCTCSCADKCPLGRTGMSERCTISDLEGDGFVREVN